MEQKLTLKLKAAGKWQVVEMPPVGQITAKILETWIGKPCVLEFVDFTRTVYAYGNEDVRGTWEHDKCVMDMDNFCHYWMYKLLEFGIDTFSKIENTEERTHIMAAEGESKAAIADVIASRPDLYQPELTADDF